MYFFFNKTHFLEVQFFEILFSKLFSKKGVAKCSLSTFLLLNNLKIN